MNISRMLLAGLAFLVLTLVALTALFAKLPYKTTDLDFISSEIFFEQTVPAPDFYVDNVRWNVEYYRDSPELADYRNFFDENCSNMKGIAAADCIAKTLQARVPFGEPGSDAFSPDYDPHKSLRDHLNGLPGHCVNFSALTATALLSKGIPAMFVQVMSPTKGGHNVISVWDEKHGWVFFDPLNSVVVKRGERLISPAEAVATTGKMRTAVYNNNPNKSEYVMKDFYDRELPFDGAVIYPEPWYYTRLGESHGGLVYRGRMIGVGHQTFQLGVEQKLLTVGIITNICLLLLTLTMFVVHQRKIFRRLRYSAAAGYRFRIVRTAVSHG